MKKLPAPEGRGIFRIPTRAILQEITCQGDTLTLIKGKNAE